MIGKYSSEIIRDNANIVVVQIVDREQENHQLTWYAHIWNRSAEILYYTVQCCTVIYIKIVKSTAMVQKLYKAARTRMGKQRKFDG